MTDVIQLLPDSIANQIAAGEVVQRPASVVKELLENSIDAGASKIGLIIREAGKSLIRVVDDGLGMSETDARMSLERHATSKIRSIDDLQTLTTMGFRGEALASIAAVSQMEIKTRTHDQDVGTSIIVEGSAVRSQEPGATSPGTSISVKNLFFNIPARRNFLKSNPVEQKHIVEEFLKVALANNQVEFSFYAFDEVIYDLPASNLSQRIVNIFGKTYREQLAACNEETNYVSVSGFVGKPESAKRTRGEQYLFVNGRYIRSNYLHHAVMNAFESLLPEDTYPFYVLFIQTDPSHVDVNIHPTKTEVKFDDERAVYAVVRAAVKQALASHNLTPTLDFSDDVNMVTKLDRLGTGYFESEERSASNIENWTNLFEGDARLPKELKFESAINRTEEIPVRGRETGFPVQWLRRYILYPVREGLMFIDQEAAHERILYEKYMHQLTMNTGESQQSLFPPTLHFSTADFGLIGAMENDIRALGFQFEVFGKDAIVIEGFPAGIESGNERELFEGLIEQFKINKDRLTLPVKENLARSLAKRASLKNGRPLVKEEMESVAGRLMACKSPALTPDGNPTFHIFEGRKLDGHFSRTS